MLDARQISSQGAAERKGKVGHWMREAYRRAHRKKWVDGGHQRSREGRVVGIQRRTMQAGKAVRSQRDTMDDIDCKACASGGDGRDGVLENGRRHTSAVGKSWGTQEHLFYKCQWIRRQVGPPTDLTQRALGWPREEDTRAHAMEDRHGWKWWRVRCGWIGMDKSGRLPASTCRGARWST